MKYFILTTYLIISAFCLSQKAEFFVKKRTITFPKTEEGEQLKYKYRKISKKPSQFADRKLYEK